MAQDSFNVSLGRHWMSSLVHYTQGFWRWLGNVETKALSDEIADVDVDEPVYISGLARSGSTILLRVLSTHHEVVTHQYRDFPFIYIPFWWQQTLDRSVKGELEAAERAHKDRLKVTPESPEAMEEVLWMAFFDGLHDPSDSNVLDASTDNSEFADFYRDHIRKLLHVRSGSRYAAKGNYNITRLEYLLKLFPDARFVIPVRQPRTHVASSRKQHRLFCEDGADNDRAITHLERVGHYEFGPHRRPINAGDRREVEAVESLWEEGQEVRGWARYWAHIYDFVADRLEQNDELREATTVVRYEDLCDETASTLAALLEHCDLADRTDHLVDRYAGRISRPDYYEADFTDAEESAIVEETREAAARFGYHDADSPLPLAR